ncbi:MAG: 6-pyruvoyl trahydropterin synthase family protein [Solirubrobacterales bacterium]
MKLFDDFSCAHRLHEHAGHGRFLHGYARSFEITFSASALDATGLVIDFSDFKDVKQLLSEQFDHTTVVAHDDPFLSEFERLETLGIVALRVMDHAGVECAAEWTFDRVDTLVSNKTDGRVRVGRVEARESPKNAVILGAARP